MPTVEKKITWPVGIQPTAHEILRTLVLTQPFWRESVERRLAAQDIYAATDGDPPVSILSPSVRELLLLCMALPGLTLTPASVNRTYLQVLGAVQGAEAFDPAGSAT